ncbi:DNA adenine methylase [Yersinia hibernica]|uniref:site-specific DNA-methyltransferase (adenine-specific) n=1 Tax=Yersinia enterocolitica LC20 TaxID=1443113 RepID=A0A7U4GIU3_YEREN|nr:DNA adenine methylase [Yersinia hibernica]AHM76349.1 hypothetical protein LC20_05098 [Yersinia hibernica]HDL7032567.1 DNA adenine methylase [Yersinia enterocolitica]
MGYRYIGSKVKILDKVLGKISEISPVNGYIADLMCGTASVSAELRKSNYRVIANDLMTYSYHHAVVNLKFSEEPSFVLAVDYIKRISDFNKLKSNYENVIDYLNSSEPVEGYFWREFSSDGTPKLSDKPRNYYSVDNAKKIDGIREKILFLKPLISDFEYSLLVHDLIMATNDIANIAGTYGHYMANLVGRAKTPLQIRPSILLLKDDVSNHTVMLGYAEDNAKKIKCDVCYIDPPYMKRQYAANYHILETIARGDEPDAIGVSGLRPWRDQHSNFCTKTKIRESFLKIFRDMDCNNFLISYSEDGLLRIDDFIELLSPLGDVYIDEFNHKRFKSNNSVLNNNLTEYLIHLVR